MRYRMLGWSEALDESVEETVAALGMVAGLEVAWSNGFGDPDQPQPYNDDLTESLERACKGGDAVALCQPLVLARANPFPKAFAKACERQNPHLVAMFLESESQSEAEFRLGTLPHPDAEWVVYARILLGLRRQARKRFLGLE